LVWAATHCNDDRKFCDAMDLGLKETIRETIRKDLEINELEKDMVFDRTLWRRLIHVADPI